MKKTILLLGGKPIGSIEIINRLKERGFRTIVTDFLPTEKSPAKKIADEAWDISTADIETLATKTKEAGVDGVISGVNEFNINRLLDLCDVCHFPCYCTRSTWQLCNNKADFKKMCDNAGIPTAKAHQLKDFQTSTPPAYPVIVKPVDGSGSRGFHICNNLKELEAYYEKAKEFSPSDTVLIEDYIPYNAVIIHYTMIDGKCVYSGMSDKISVKFKNTGASVMGLQTFPSIGEKAFLRKHNASVKKMFENAGLTNGPIWIESFYDGNETFIFNEMGHRFGGSLTYYPVEYFTGINQLDALIDASAGIHVTESAHSTLYQKTGLNYCILPIHIKAGMIADVQQTEALQQNDRIHAIVPVHFIGDEIQDWGSAQQVYAYVHILYENNMDLVNLIKFLLKNLIVSDTEGNNMIHTLFDINSLAE